MLRVDPKLEKITEVYKQVSTKDLTKYDENFLRKAVITRLKKRSITAWDEYAQLLLADPDEGDALREELTITTSFFFRDHLNLSTLQSILLLLRSNKKDDQKALRIWCAGCTAVQEPYSIAIALQDLQDRLGIKWNRSTFVESIH